MGPSGRESGSWAGHVGSGLRPMSVNAGQVLRGQYGAPTGQSPKWGDLTFVPRVSLQPPPLVEKELV